MAGRRGKGSVVLCGDGMGMGMGAAHHVSLGAVQQLVHGPYLPV